MPPENVILSIVLGYMIGSLPTAYLLGRLNGINIFEIGSGNMGTTNTIRAMGVKWGATVWIVDIAKGMLAIMIARALLAPHLGWANLIGGVTAIIGHNWSFFAILFTGKLLGGKGAATWLGAFIMIVPVYVIAGIAIVFAAIVALTRYVSLGVLVTISVGALAIFVLATFGILEVGSILFAIIAAVLIFYRHRSNIERLLAGTERRLGEHV